MGTPEGWLETTIGAVSTLQRGFDLPVQDRQRGIVPVIASNGPVGTHSIARVQGPGVVTGRSGTIGKVFYSAHGFWPLNTTLYVDDFHGNDPLFVFHFLGAQDLGRFAASTGVPSLNRNFVHPAPALLPPLPEQRKIAAILSSLDETIEKTEAVIDQLQVVKKAMMEELLTRGMPGRHTRFKQTEIGEIPEGWEVRRLDDVSSRIVVGVVVKPASYYASEGVPALRSLNVKEDRIVLDNLVRFSAESNQVLSKSMLRAGDVVTVRTGAPGTSAVVPPALDGANCIDIIITTPTDRVSGAFLSRFINSERGKGAVARGQGGLAQQHFNVGEMRQMLIPVPPVAEQLEVVDVLRSVDARIEGEVAAVSRMRAVKAALSASLLAGDLRVTPDEPPP
ncbi:MAG: restriction endonuclease subunit S [Polyangiales bacterium]